MARSRLDSIERAQGKGVRHDSLPREFSSTSRSPFGAIFALVRRVEQVGWARAPAALSPVCFFDGGTRSEWTGVEKVGGTVRLPSPPGPPSPRPGRRPAAPCIWPTATHRPRTRSGPTSPSCIFLTGECGVPLRFFLVARASTDAARGDWTGKGLVYVSVVCVRVCACGSSTRTRSCRVPFFGPRHRRSRRNLRVCLRPTTTVGVVSLFCFFFRHGQKPPVQASRARRHHAHTPMYTRPHARPTAGAAPARPTGIPRQASLCRGGRRRAVGPSTLRAAPPRAADETTARSTPLTQVDLATYLESGCKPREAWRCAVLLLFVSFSSAPASDEAR